MCLWVIQQFWMFLCEQLNVWFIISSKLKGGGVVNTAVKLYSQVRQRDNVGYCWLLCVCEAGRHFHYLYKFDAQLKKYIS